MSSTRTSPSSDSPAFPAQEGRTVLRAKTIATRVSTEELAEIEEAAERDGKTVAEWLRELAIKSARRRGADPPANPMELVLSEIAATRYMLLTLFHSTAQARREGVELLPETVLQIRDAADRRKYETARKMLQDFLAQDGPAGGKS